jgi:type II secretory pathway component PulF
MKLAYQAFDRAGRAVSATIDALDPADASERLRRQGLFVASVSPVGTEPSQVARTHKHSRRSPPGRLKNLAMFTRQLQVLISTGSPVVQSLAALERQSTVPAWREVIADIRHKVENGSTLAEALHSHPECFDSIYRSLISAGESGGQLEPMLQRLSTLTRQQLRMRSSIIGAMIYPSLLMCVAAGVLILMVVFILPRFAGLYETLDATLPPITQLLMNTSNALRHYWWAVIGGIVALATAIKMWLATPAGRRAWDGIAVRAPQFGRIVRSLATARIARILGVLVESHVPLLEALNLTKLTAGNVHYAELIAKAEDAVTRGDSMSHAIADSQLISAYVVEAIRNGEQTGQIGPLLLNIADFLDEENEVVIKSLTSILEPLILIVLGVLIGLVAVSMFMPLFDLTAMMQQGGAG